MKDLPLVKTISKRINLQAEIDSYDKIHKTIEEEIRFRGTNLWILVAAIIIASVG